MKAALFSGLKHLFFSRGLDSQIFMNPDFALEDPATFNSVLPWSHFNSAGGKSSRDVASSKLLQEKVRTRSVVLLCEVRVC